METGQRSHRIVERIGERGVHLCVTAQHYTVTDAEDDAARYLTLMQQIEQPIVGISDFSAMGSLEPGARTVWSHVMADHGDRFVVVYALLPGGTIGKIVGMAASAWGMAVGVHISCYSDREKWIRAAASSGVKAPRRHGAA